ncbi:nuclear transport factor 2 family protein [Streptomyces sp. NBC_01497]|uniref:nuclear transport factor 2 family protein n=1 Tax=Streptomyces sp. NBC_01497 TaxID=2903885 RepID=UPI002E315609|nr:nuclear transport factor 2 family protein [Streptomyces sp. NBC_01497]
MTTLPADPVVASFVTALNAGDRDAFRAVLTDDATMSDDGSERDLAAWTDREIFSSSGHLEVESQSDDGLSLVADYSNATYGHMRTRWSFTVRGERISRFETGQA